MKNIRNFVIISHIDHGKSTLADRFLELTKTIPPEKMRPQFLDLMDLEREKGITIKLRPVRMELEIPNSKIQIPNDLGIRHSDLEIPSSKFILNLIDTPGHVDFSYEVSRSLAAVEGAILLVDATKGIQAQTIYNLELAKKQKLKIIPAVNKIDLSQAQIEKTQMELAILAKVPKEEVFLISAKYGTNVENLLKSLIEKFPPPKGEEKKPLKTLIFDSKYDPYKGIIAYVRVFNGKVRKNDTFYLIQNKIKGKVKEVGIFKPDLTPTEELKAGEIGYIATGIKTPEKVRVGDTLIKIPNSKFQISKLEVEPLPGYKEPKPVVFTSFYPENASDYDLLKKALEQLKLNDAALTFEPEMKESLGRGFRCGFLGSLHAEITSERLKREFGLELVISKPQVSFKVIDKKDREIFVFSAADWPDPTQIKETQEPWVKLEILTPPEFLGQVLKLLKSFGGNQVGSKYLSSGRILLIYEIPLREIIVDFYDKLKGVSQGFASMNYEILGYKKADLVKVDILIAGKKEEALSMIVPRYKAYQEGKKIVQKLKELLKPQLFSLPIQAALYGKIIARETLRAKGKDVTAPLYGGDYTRKKKLLEKQKAGKKKLSKEAKIKIPSKTFFQIFRS